MPPHDETSPSRRAPARSAVQPPARSPSTGGGGACRRGGRPAAGGRARTPSRRGGRRAGGTGGRGGRRSGDAARRARRPGGSGAGAGRAAARASARTKQQRRRRLKIAGGVLAGMLVLLGVFVGVVYASTDVPSPDSITNAQTTVLYYSDGTTEMARLGDENRTNVTLDQISEPAQQRGAGRGEPELLHRPGHLLHRHRPRGVEQPDRRLDAGRVDDHPAVREERDPENSDQTFSRKFQELFLAIKLDNNYSKDQILENYLNTIYYGRGAYGIEAAANTYFGVPAAQLTAAAGRGARRPDPQPIALRPRGQPGGRAGPLGPGARRDGRARAG